MPWYFLWSKNYRIFHEILKDTMKEPELKLCPIEIPQERFDSELYQYELGSGKHFWHGSYIKVNAVIESLEKAESEYILFSDIDMIVKPGVYDLVKPYMDDGYDMVYLSESNKIAIGFMLLKTNGKALEFWKSVKAAMEAEMDLDQKYVNSLIETFDGKWGKFEPKEILCMNEWDGTSPYKVLQLVCSNLSKEYNMAEKIFYMAQQIELTDYMHYVDEEILPYIYGFQEILMRTWAKGKESTETSAEPQ